jgi:NADH-quinone oxidoreductase subunit K
MVPLNWYMMLSAAVFCVGIFGFMARKNIILMFISIELMLNAVNINLVAMSHYLEDLTGQVLSFFVITVAAAEASIGLAIIIALFRNKETANVDEMREMRG